MWNCDRRDPVTQTHTNTHAHLSSPPLTLTLTPTRLPPSSLAQVKKLLMSWNVGKTHSRKEKWGNIYTCNIHLYTGLINKCNKSSHLEKNSKLNSFWAVWRSLVRHQNERHSPPKGDFWIFPRGINVSQMSFNIKTRHLFEKLIEF